jgi:sulfur-oxidizing protein SoxX
VSAKKSFYALGIKHDSEASFMLMAGKLIKICNSASPGRTRSRVLLTGLFVSITVAAMTVTTLAAQAVDGKDLVMQRSRGNCLACHAIADGKLPGNIGPPLVSMKARFPDEDTLRRQIWDASVLNPDTRMPPFGRHGILSHEEIELIVEYLYTL